MKYLSFLIILFSINSFAITCTDDEIDLNPGDVISADMVKDIFDRISGVTSGMTPEELDGTWMCTSLNRTVGTLNGYSPSSDGIGSSMSQDITFTKQSDDTFIVTYQNDLGLSAISVPPGQTCKGKLVTGALFIMNPSGTCNNGGLFGMNRISKQCFVWEVSSHATSCQKKSTAPLAPKNLTATLSGSSVSLSWTAGDSNTASYTVKAKTSNTGTYNDVITDNNDTSFTDTLSSGTKWYRVYGVNASGTSTGSNVVSVSR